MDSVAPPLYAHVHNALLSYLRSELKIGDRLPIQSELSRLCGAKRTTMHRVLGTMRKHKLLERDGGRFRLTRQPLKGDFLPCPSALSRRESVEQSLLAMLVNGDLRSGQRFSELSLARKLSVTTVTIREALLRLSKIGILSKSERQQWSVVKMDEKFVNDFMDIRVLVESFALERYFRGDHAQRQKFERIFQETKTLSNAARIDRGEFFRLDRELHETILQGADNRCLLEHFLYASFPIQLQYLHRELNQAFLRNALSEHLSILRAIHRHDARAALNCLSKHLVVSRKTLLKLI
jgi:DNA-binding GntR family transcriptional regulator